jgi:hypothetical protein
MLPETTSLHSVTRTTVHRVPREHVYQIWPLLYRGVGECLRGGLQDAERSHEHVLDNLLSPFGEELFVIMLDRNTYAGFITLQILKFETEVWGTIGMLFVEPQEGVDVIGEGMPAIEAYVKRLGCTHLNYVTERKAFQRLGPKLGFRSRLVEWVKEVV